MKNHKIKITDSKSCLIQLQNTRKRIKKDLKQDLVKYKGFKCSETLKVTFQKTLDKDKTTYKSTFQQHVTPYLNSAEEEIMS